MDMDRDRDRDRDRERMMVIFKRFSYHRFYIYTS
jgi:hypothetical protein